MPNKLSKSMMVKRDQKKLESLLAWTETIPNISRDEMKELIKFGARYGQYAMVRRAQSLVDKRKLVSDRYLADVRVKNILLFSLRAMKGLSSTYPKQERKILGIRKSFVPGFAQRIEPILRSILTLAFTKKVVYRFMSPEELAKLSGVNDNPQNRELLKSILERRSGTTISKLMRGIQDEVERDFVEMWAANIKDGLIFGKNPDIAEKYEEWLKKGNLAEMTSSLMKGIH